MPPLDRWHHLDIDMLEDTCVIEQLDAGDPGRADFLKPAFKEGADGWCVRGQRTPWPAAFVDRRLCKYAAMLTGHPAFDHLRRAFVLPKASQRQYVLSTMNDTNCELLMPVVAFLTDENRAVIGFEDLTSSRLQPLCEKLWEAYLHTCLLYTSPSPRD